MPVPGAPPPPGDDIPGEDIPGDRPAPEVVPPTVPVPDVVPVPEVVPAPEVVPEPEVVPAVMPPVVLAPPIPAVDPEVDIPDVVSPAVDPAVEVVPMLEVVPEPVPSPAVVPGVLAPEVVAVVPAPVVPAAVSVEDEGVAPAVVAPAVAEAESPAEVSLEPLWQPIVRAANAARAVSRMLSFMVLFKRRPTGRIPRKIAGGPRFAPKALFLPTRRPGARTGTVPFRGAYGQRSATDAGNALAFDVSEARAMTARALGLAPWHPLSRRALGLWSSWRDAVGRRP